MKHPMSQALHIFIFLAWAAVPSNSVFAAQSVPKEDVATTIYQSAVDKVLTSISYPYTAFDGPGSREWGCIGIQETSELIRRLNSKRSAEYSADEVKLAEAINSAKEETDRIIQYVQSGKLGGGAPPLADLIAMREFWEGKRSDVPSTLKRGCCTGLQYRVDHLLIDVTQRPNVSLGQARINIQKVNLYVKGWISFRTGMQFWCFDCWLPCVLCSCSPHPCCWISPSVQIRPSSAIIASAYLQPQQVSANGNPEIGFFLHFIHLNLNWLKIVDWGWIVNHYVLKDKPLAKISLSDLGFDITQIKRRVTVSSIRFIDEPNSLPISITIEVEPKSNFRLFPR